MNLMFNLRMRSGLIRRNETCMYRGRNFACIWDGVCAYRNGVCMYRNGVCTYWLPNFNKRLKYFEVADWSPKNQQEYLDRIALFVPAIRHLSIPITSITKRFQITDFRLAARGSGMSSELDLDHPLETLELTHNYHAIRPPASFRIQLVMAYLAIATILFNLRTFRVDDALGWWSCHEKRMILAAIYQTMEHSAQIRGNTSKIDVSGVRGISNHTRIHSR